MPTPNSFPTQAEAEIIIRSTMTVRDIGAMALVTQRASAFREDQPLPDQPSHEAVADIEERITKDGFWTYMATDQNRMAGFVLGHPSSEQENIPSDPDVEYLSLLMIDPDYWGQRVASRLLDAAAERAKHIGRKEMVLWTSQTNHRARQVYEHKGFVLTDQTRISEYRGPQVQYSISL